VKLFILIVVSIQKMHEALSNLEKVTVGLKRRKLHIELEAGAGCDLSRSWRNSERILHKFASGLVEHLQKVPVDFHWEAKLVLNRNCFRLAQTTRVCELKVDRLKR
jgi:hypothetical protein